jgi:hypothetical protein
MPCEVLKLARRTIHVIRHGLQRRGADGGVSTSTDRSTGVPLPWATKRGQVDIVGSKLRPVLDAAGIDRAISFTSFRHGGMTELGDSDLTDRQIRAVSRHKSSKVLSRYVKRTHKQIIDATHKRRANRPAKAEVNDGQMDLFGGKKS